ncbi:serpin peptidase inhibitor, clade A (alpha-1 antiproteinase, antitrypsin), member 7 precursor [Danio rerio]|uniref:Thyroxine-binding globulin n=1 Tax=Danio rerio TaxID=7955 RepID=F8W5C3_DANRE|nr:serpin peptidase inhibitor, clade A (alpha-1 antiproteinase, antitrypsin), member 7 precursor [Danio rerio]|eukprot:NP_001099059.2 serpin peptidase inhibitor, clade A (alpha-1 antiproteinase, antitrypsin), member 7 precursor [Danio rerio]
MEQNGVFLWIFGFAIVVCGNQETLQQPPISAKLPSLINMNNDFAFHLYKRLIESPDYQSKNIFFSPFSVSMALSELSLGAGGDTKQQLLSGIGYNSAIFSTEEMHQLFHSLLEEIGNRTEVDIDVGTALYASDRFKPHSKFLEDMKEFYHSDGFTVDFSVKETVDQINKYVEEKTHGKISQAVDNLEKDTLMFLLTYIYFKGKWDKPFKPETTSESTFYIDDKTTVPVQMMHQYEHLKVYYDVELFTKVLCLDYNDSFSMILAVPDVYMKQKTMKDLEMTVSRQHIEKWRRSVSERKVDIYVPKLSLKTSYSLKDILKGMGMTDMFSDKADFTGVSEENIFVSKVLHKATLDIDEQGTTAAAVTGVEIRPTSYDPLSDLKFDHPFMIFITDQTNDNILFVGKVVNPNEKL